MSRPTVRSLVATGAAAVTLGAVAVAGPAAAHTRAVATTWAPASTATIHPGVQTVTNGAQCTSDFVFVDGTNVYLGQAAHCSGTGGSTATNGCQAQSLPLGTSVQISGASKPGTMVYNSWIAMQQAGEKDPDTCAYNDLALVQVDPADVGKVNPSVPFWGGPTGIDTTGTQAGDTVLSYGNSELRLGVSALSPKQGVSVGDAGNGWSHQVYTATPGIPGDSGSAFLSAQGSALGVLSTVEIAPLAGSNGVGDLARELAYAQAHGMSGVTLADGTEPFRGPLP